MVKLIIPKKSSINISDKSTLKVCYGLYYHKSWIVRQIFKTRLNKTLRLVPNKKYRLSLDVGTGTGIILLTLSRISDRVVALELKSEDSSHLNEMCKKEGLNNVKIEDMDYDFMNIKLKDKSSDLILCLSAIEHCKNLELAVKELKRLLSRDGLLIISYPIEEFLTNFIYRLLGLKDVNKECHYNTYKQIRTAVKKHFKIIDKKKLPLNFLPSIFSNYEILSCKK